MTRAPGVALAVALSLARPGATQTLVPRLAPSKPPRTVVGATHATDRVILKLREGTGVRLRGGRFVTRGVDVGALAQTLRAYGLGPADVERAFDRPETALDAEREAFQARSGRALADLNLYYRVRLPAGTDVASLCDALNALSLVEVATPALRPVPPPLDLAPPTPDLSPGQGYRDAAHGIGVPDPGLYPGSDGDGRTLVDVEYSWLLEHEDLELPATAVLDPATPADPFPEDEANHGTAVLGELVAGDNGYGVTGLVPRSTLRLAPASTEEHGYDVGRAVSLATGVLTEGDVILIEQQICVCGRPCREDSQDGLGPVEPIFDSTRSEVASDQ